MNAYANVSLIENKLDELLSENHLFELDGLKIQTSSRLVLTDALMNKIKGLARKLNSAYKEAFFADRIGVVEDVNPPGEPADDGDDENTTSGEFVGFFDGEGGEPSDES